MTWFWPRPPHSFGSIRPRKPSGASASRLRRGKVSVLSFSAASGRMVSSQICFRRSSSPSCSSVRYHSGLNMGSSPFMAESGTTVAIQKLLSWRARNILTTRHAPGLWCLGQLLFRESLDLGHPERPSGPDPQAVEHEGDRTGGAERGDRVATAEVHRQRDRHGGERDGGQDREDTGTIPPRQR